MASPDDMLTSTATSLQQRAGSTLERWLALVDAAARAAGWVRPAGAQYVDARYTLFVRRRRPP